MIQFFLTNQNNAENCMRGNRDQDLQIVQFSHLKIDHQEGKPAELVLKIAMPYRQDISETDLSFYQYGYLVYSQAHEGNQPENPKKILFFGQLRETIAGVHDIRLVLVSDIQPFENQWAIIARQIKKEHPPHEVWTQENPDTILASAPYVLYWDRCTGKLGISHVQPDQPCVGQEHANRKTRNVISDYDPNHRYEKVRSPLTTVNVEMVARWDEIGLRYINIGQQIERQFPNHCIRTATPLSLERGWPKISRLSNRYFISKSTLTEKARERYRIPVPNGGQEPQKSVFLEFKLYDAQLEVGYIYNQPRQETLKYALKMPTVHTELGREESMVIHVPRFVQDDLFPVFRYHSFYQKGDIVQQEGRVYQYCAEPGYNQGDLFSKNSSFSNYTDVWQELPEYSKRVLPVFSDTIFGLNPDPTSFKLDLGKEFVQYSLKCAKIKFLKDRSHIIELRGTLHDWHDMTLNDTIEIDDLQDSETNQQMKCKVIRYQLEYTNGSIELAHIHLEAAVDVGRLHLKKPSQAEAPLSQNAMIVDGVALDFSTNLPQPCPIKNKPEDEFCHVVVLNKPKDQILAIEEREKNATPWTKDQSIPNKNTRILIKAKTKKEEADALNSRTRSLEHTIVAVTRLDSNAWFKI